MFNIHIGSLSNSNSHIKHKMKQNTKDSIIKILQILILITTLVSIILIQSVRPQEYSKSRLASSPGAISMGYIEMTKNTDNN